MKIKYILCLAAAICLGGTGMAATLDLGVFGTLPWEGDIRAVQVEYDPYVREYHESPMSVDAPVALPGEENEISDAKIYQLQAEGPDAFHTAWLYRTDIRRTERTETLFPFFRGELGPERQQSLNEVNLSLYMAETMMNAYLREATKDMLTKLPLKDISGAYPPLQVRLRDIEPLQRVDGAKEVVYSVGMRAAAIIDDGLVLPYYLRGYAVQRGDQIAVALLIVNDTERVYFRDRLHHGILKLESTADVPFATEMAAAVE